MEVLVEHDYTAKDPNELSLIKGDIIKDVVKKQSGWFEGTLKDRKGIFPDSCVKIIEKDTIGVILRNRKDVARIRQCRVVYSYKQEHEDELNLNVGDIIEILGEEEEGWWRGLLNGKEGVFPSNFVEEIQQTKPKLNNREHLTIDNDDETPSLPAKPQKIMCEVKYPYKAQNDDELTLKEGDLVTLLSKDGQDPGWWKGELNGVIGVFPDNFVVVLPANANEEKSPRHQSPPLSSSSPSSQIIKEEKRPKTQTEPISIKPSSSNINNSSLLSQRKSLENQINEKHESETITKTTPPIPGKKPMIPLKKSPNSTNSSSNNTSINSGGGGGGGGIFHGLKKKIVDVVDGATGSKTISSPKTEMSNHETSSENVFDDVQRRPLLSDVRASRPKAPGRRLPSGIYKESDFSGMMNGNTDHNQIMDSIQTTTPPPQQLLSSTVVSNLSSSPPEQDTVDNKPKLREWEKHKAPWLEEMKLNQAKRTSTSPGPPEHKLKLTPTERSIDSSLSSSSSSPAVAAIDEKNKQLEKDTNLIGHKLKTPPNELERTSIIRNKPNVPIATRPQTIHNISSTTTTTSATINESITTVTTTKPSTPLYPRVSPLLTKTPSPLQQNIGDSRHNIELLIERINKLEDLVKKQSRDIDVLKGKLQIETEMRMELQAKFENYIECSTIQQL